MRLSKFPHNESMKDAFMAEVASRALRMPARARDEKFVILKACGAAGRAGIHLVLGRCSQPEEPHDVQRAHLFAGAESSSASFLSCSYPPPPRTDSFINVFSRLPT
eukprot:299142-Pleurochrysis_carterae.AAC.1